jgi:hypothetical protein
MYGRPWLVPWAATTYRQVSGMDTPDWAGRLRSRVRARYVPDRIANLGKSRSTTGNR